MKQTDTLEDVSIIEYCDALAEKGQLSIKWDGGNDSGWFRLCIDGEELPYEEGEAIINIADSILGYGSFAGDYNTEGELFYDKATKTFIGEDNFSSNDNTTTKLGFQVKIPTSIWFDRIQIVVAGDAYDNYSESTSFITVDNGPVSDEHVVIEEKILSDLIEHIKSLDPEISIDSVWDQWDIPYADFKKKGSYMVYKMDNLNYSYCDIETKEVEINLNEHI